MMTFEECVAAAADNQDLVAEWDRLTGHRLRAINRRSPIEIMIDRASGFEEARWHDIAHDFIAFVFECVWLRVANGA